MICGIKQQGIFKDNEDRQRFIETLERVKNKTDIEIYAYCLMNNHVHILIKERKMKFGKLQKIGTSYLESKNRTLRKTKEIKGSSILQIHRITGINRTAIKKA